VQGTIACPGVVSEEVKTAKKILSAMLSLKGKKANEDISPVRKFCIRRASSEGIRINFRTTVSFGPIKEELTSVAKKLDHPKGRKASRVLVQGSVVQKDGGETKTLGELSIPSRR